MEKSSQSSLTGDSSAASNGGSTATTGRDQYLKHLNKLSHKISKPSFVKKPGFDSSSVHSNPNFNQNQSFTQPPPPPLPESAVQAQSQQPPQHHQPPVYNINKNDFRDVVQKLTGSPAHERFSNPPPIHPPKPQSSRLQRIRPPPLANVSNRPPPMLNSGLPPPQPQQQQPPPGLNPRNSISSANTFGSIGRPTAPLSPLPPLPAVHAPAESPVSAYMRYLHNSFSTLDSNQKQFSGFSPLAPLVSPRWNNSTSQQQLPPPAMAQGSIPPPPPPPSSAVMASESQFQMPSSPLPFGCMNSPRSGYPLLSPSLLFSPSTGPLGYSQFPLSPTVPVPSPRWRGL